MDAIRMAEKIGATTVSSSRLALERAMDVHYPALVRRLTMVVGDPHEAQDLAQATFMRALEAWGSFDGRDVRAWLYTIGLRLAANEKRRRRRLGAFMARRQEPELHIVSDPDLWRALAGLDRRTRAAILLHELDGYTYEEIGRMLHSPAGTVGSWIARGKVVLRAALAEEQA